MLLKSLSLFGEKLAETRVQKWTRNLGSKTAPSARPSPVQHNTVVYDNEVASRLVARSILPSPVHPPVVCHSESWVEQFTNTP